MNILAIVKNKEKLSLIRKVAKQQKYRLSVISDNDTLKNLKQHSKKPPVVNFSAVMRKYQIIIIDKEFFMLFCSLNQEFFQEDLLNYPILLILNGYSKKSIQEAAEAPVSTTIHFPFSHEELIVRLNAIVKQFQAMQKIKNWAFKDSLTNLHNRRIFFTYISAYQKIYQENKNPFCLALIDLDFFKKVNDEHGHLKGDEILVNISQIMEENIRKTDFLARIGGEEFAIIFPNTKIEAAYKILERISLKVKQFHDKDGVSITLSSGILEANNLYKTPDDIIKAADNLLYQAKAQGRDQILKQK